MGVRGEIFSTKVSLQNRTYFFNVKENRLGDLYLNIVESKNREEGGFERQSVILFAEDLQEFLQGFDESLRVLEKATREKRRGTPNSTAKGPLKRQHESGGRREGKPAGASGYERKKNGGPGRKDSGPGTQKARYKAKDHQQKNRGEFPPRKKRVVVKKR